MVDDTVPMPQVARMPVDTPPLSDAERRDRLRLARSENIGPVTYRMLMTRFDTAGMAIDALPELAHRGGRRRPLRIAEPEGVEQELEAVARLGAAMLFQDQPDYPAALAALDSAPVALTLLGDRSLLDRDAVAVVGARNASSNGRRFAQHLATELAADGLVVVSGFARGIDTAAHRGALTGGTIAVMAGGVDVVYPEENRDLYAALREDGLILSEAPCGLQPRGRHFPRRNRVISGLALGVVVVEAALRSGSLTTARLAAEQGREVFAVPGSPLDPRCRGTNMLIRQGAKLTEGADDVLEELAGMRNRTPLPQRRPALADPATEVVPPAGDTSDLHHRIIEQLGPSPLPVDTLIRDVGAPAATIRAALLELELAGRVERQPGNLVARLAD